VRHASAQEFFEFVFADSGGKLHFRILSRLESTGTTTQRQLLVLSTINAPAYRCNRLETKPINIEEIVFSDPRKALTEEGVGIIVEKVPRGLRNSKPPET
jgi:hypothetical protein